MVANIGEEQLHLLGDKGLFWPIESMLIVADVHLGKAGHFRKQGIALPSKLDVDIAKLDRLIEKKDPEQVVFLGDLFHSELNHEWKKLDYLIESYPNVNFTLVEGNHDILESDHYKRSGLGVVPELVIRKLSFTHEPSEESRQFNIHGHIHPGVRLSGKARQSLKVPCFHITNTYMTIPAFGSLTGVFAIKPSRASKVVGVVDDKLMILNGEFP